MRKQVKDLSRGDVLVDGRRVVNVTPDAYDDIWLLLEDGLGNRSSMWLPAQVEVVVDDDV